MKSSILLTIVLGLFVVACPGTSSLSGVFTGDATLSQCNASGTLVATTAKNEMFRVRDDGDALQVTWRGCSFVGTDQNASAPAWTVATQSCTLDNVATTVHGAIYRPHDDSPQLTVQIYYKPTAQTGPCESYLDLSASR